SPKWFKIPKEKLYFTVFGGADVASGTTLSVDEEAAGHWVSVGAAPDRVIAVPGLKENFWAMGDTGPCGPCSEIHYDMGPAASDQGHTDCAFGCECGRYVEIWNLVFMQFDRDASGKLNPLPKPSIDTGMGLERVTAVLQGVESNYDTDLFTPLLKAIEDIAGTKYRRSMNPTDVSMRVVADHARSMTFLIADGVMPSNEWRGYVLRKIMRRAMRHGMKLGATEPFLYALADVIVREMGDAYPELRANRDMVRNVIRAEEDRFVAVLAGGLPKLE